MRWIVARAVKAALLVSIAVGITAIVSPGLRSILLDVYLVVIGGVFLLALVRTTQAKAPLDGNAEFDQALTRMRGSRLDTTRLPLVRTLELSTLNAFHLHMRLRPVMREIAAHRLRAQYGVDLDSEPVRARELVGSSAWELVRPDRPIPADRLASGPPLSELRNVVGELERI